MRSLQFESKALWARTLPIRVKALKLFRWLFDDLNKEYDLGKGHDLSMERSPLQPTSKTIILVTCVLYLIMFVSWLRQSLVDDTIARLSCTSVHWTNANQCGLDGRNCRPFTGQSLVFRCPSGCTAAEITTPRWVGHQRINHCPLVIGGRQNADDDSSGIYRGDSFFCQAAIHAGVIKKGGGCAELIRRGESRNFPSTYENNIQSIGFDGAFPLSYSFKALTASTSQTGCTDLRWWLTGLTIAFTFFISMITTPTPLTMILVFISMFFNVALVSDPPDEPAYANYANVVSAAFGRFLPASFVFVVYYHRFIRRTLVYYARRTEKTCWLFSAWIGALCNYTLRFVPLQRLTIRDLREQPGATLALIMIVFLIAFVGVGQAYGYRQAGRLREKIWTCLGLGSVLFFLALIPGQTLRIHHYILFLILAPFTDTRSWVSQISQGFLTGFFVNGVARWNFASILEPESAIFAGRPAAGPIPHDISPTLAGTTLSFAWNSLPVGCDGIQVLVNDVLRFQGFVDDGMPVVFNWTWVPGSTLYFLFCCIMHDHIRGLSVGECTAPFKWTSDGQWIASEHHTVTSSP